MSQNGSGTRWKLSTFETSGTLSEIYKKFTDCRRHTVARLTHHVALQTTGEYLIDDARTVSRIRDDFLVLRYVFLVLTAFQFLHFGFRVLAMSMQYIECGDEKLVCILLLIAGQMTGVRPNQMQQSMQRQWCTCSRIEFLQSIRL